jgi:hypothetical protein
MRRLVLLTYIGLTLGCFTGCHHWHRKHAKHAGYAAYESCGCAETYQGSFDGLAVPSSQVISAPPSKVIPLTPAPSITAPPAATPPAPPHT